jgi:hypothetical protein
MEIMEDSIQTRPKKGALYRYLTMTMSDEPTLSRESIWDPDVPFITMWIFFIFISAKASLRSDSNSCLTQMTGRHACRINSTNSLIASTRRLRSERSHLSRNR